MQLRDYQIDAIARVRACMAQGKRRVVMVLPTGGGKSVIAAAVAKGSTDRGKRVLALAHRTELIDQLADEFSAFGLTVGAQCASSSTPPNPYAPVQVASVQTLLARNSRPAADLIIADECHHFCDAAESFSALLKSYEQAYVLGLTATPQRGDGCGLEGCFDGLVVGATVRQLTERGVLVPCEVIRPATFLEPGQIAQNPVDAYVQHAQGRLAILFARSILLAEQYTQEFRMRGIESRTLTNETPWAERKLYIDAFKRGSIRILSSVAVLTEGFNVPPVSCAILARGCGSAGLYIQMAGRIRRSSPGKENAILLDLRGVSNVHGHPDDDREYSLDGKGIRLKDPHSYCPVCSSPWDPPGPCESCGHLNVGDDTVKSDTVTGDKLVPYAAKRAEPEEKRVATLARWIQEGRARGFKSGWAKAKFKAVYGVWATGSQIVDAERFLGGAVDREEVA